jgi:hypothetical protein
MAKTFYKYAERNVDTQINWAEVGKGVVDMLREEDRIREEKKAAIDEASREYANVLANAPTGDFKSANEWILGYASDASQARMIQDRLLKSGILKVKDYTVARQNLTDGTNQMFEVAKEYQEKAKEMMQRYQLKESQETEAWLMEQIQGLSNFKNTKAYINPTNYTVSLAGMKEQVIDGKKVMVMETDPDKYMSINQLRNRLNIRLDRYKYVDAINTQVSALGEFQTGDIRRVAGVYKMVSVKEVLDPTNRTRLSDEDKKTITAYQEWEGNMIKAELSNGYNQLSILTDAVDKVPGTQDYYEPTFDAELAKTNKKYILLEDDGSGVIKPVFTEEQTKAATEFLRAQTRNTLDRKTNIQAQGEPQPPQQSEFAYGIGQGKKRAFDFGNMIAKFYSGSDDEINAATDWLLATEGITSVKRTPSGVSVTKNGVTKDFAFEKGGSITKLNDFVAALGRFVNAEVDMNEVRRGAEAGSRGRSLNPTYQTQSQSRQVNVDADFKAYVGSLFDAQQVTQFTDNEDAAVDYFNGIIGRIPGLTGYTAQGDGTLNDGVVISDPKGETVLEFRFDGENENQATNYIQAIADLASNLATAEQKIPLARQRFQQRENQGELD